jgi:hypothetical protein
MATFKNLDEADDTIDIGDHLEWEFLEIIHLFANEWKSKNRLLSRLQTENTQLI